MKVVLAFDSFKGSLSAERLCEIADEELACIDPTIETVSCPMADGGEGTADAMLISRHGEWIPLTVTGPLFGQKVEAGFAWFPDDKTALVEMACASGLPLVPPDQRNPLETTTLGTGELIRAAIERGAEKILLAVGGSATTDGGIGAAAALGWHFLGCDKNPVPLSGKGLASISEMYLDADITLPPVEVLCDVTNPLCGPSGAAAVYGPQKGASAEMVGALDAGLLHLAELVGGKLADEPGAGAAGGLAFGAMIFFNARLVPGVETVMQAGGLISELAGADWVITGEGKLDHQSVQGKVICGVSGAASAVGVKVAAVAGSIQLTADELKRAGISESVSLMEEGMAVEYAMAHAEPLFRERLQSLIENLL
ncbi:glycerate kinase [Verrucomicrobiota bacterium]